MATPTFIFPFNLVSPLTTQNYPAPCLPEARSISAHRAYIGTLNLQRGIRALRLFLIIIRSLSHAFVASGGSFG